VSRQLSPLILVVSAALAETSGLHGLAIYLLLATVPVVVVAALGSYGDVVAGEGGSAGRTALWTLALAVVIATIALPTLGDVALIACLILVGIQGLAALTAEVRRSPTA
jgi:hypothetical protein